MILIAGATGTVGSELVKQLVEARQKVRVLVRDPAKALNLGSGVEVVKGDLSKPETLGAAFAGVDKAFVLSPPGPDLATLEGNAYDAAKRAGAKHIVKLSAAGIEADFFAAAPGATWHNESERRLRALGVAWTILRPGPFASNVINFWGIKQRGGLFLPVGTGKDAPIDPFDIAAVAVKVLTTPGHEGKIYELTGPEMLSYAEVVQKISAVTGKPSKFVDVPEATWRQEMQSAGFPPPMVDTLLAYFASVKAGRWYATSTVAELLGRPARTFEQWAKDHAAALRS
ncbi:MAG: SDR family oxidoreductase [Nitrospirae bacterium]|nr:SDR family oxidoreductase [Nitrospirota bacterium]